MIFSTPMKNISQIRSFPQVWGKDLFENQKSKTTTLIFIYGCVVSFKFQIIHWLGLPGRSKFRRIGAWHAKANHSARRPQDVSMY